MTEGGGGVKEPLLLADVICERTVPYEGYTGLLLMIFPNVPKVTRLQKLRRLRRASSGDFLLCPQSYEVTEVTKVTLGFC